MFGRDLWSLLPSRSSGERTDVERSQVITTHPICPDCLQVVTCRVLVTSGARTHILSGIEEHKRICPGRVGVGVTAQNEKMKQ